MAMSLIPAPWAIERQPPLIPDFAQNVPPSRTPIHCPLKTTFEAPPALIGFGHAECDPSLASTCPAELTNANRWTGQLRPTCPVGLGRYTSAVPSSTIGAVTPSASCS